MMILTLAQTQRFATMTRAMQVARGVVREELKRQRIRLADVDAKEISDRARAYLDAHPELYADAACQRATDAIPSHHC